MLLTVCVVYQEPRGGWTQWVGKSTYDDIDFTAVTLSMEFPGAGIALLPRTIFVRSFYNRLVERMLSDEKWYILLGNPGISKSWFQWYLMYSIAKREPAWLPKVVVHQIGMESLTYYFPHTKPVDVV